ncbi:MAG TPA: hypothetical protein VFV79_10670, partial [Saprospiraceae bacterium]|nr:hypothetical protein [Saprospiraceae bacterium]
MNTFKSRLFNDTLLLLSLAFFSACEQEDTVDVPCETHDYGIIQLMPLPNEPFPFHTDEALI